VRLRGALRSGQWMWLLGGEQGKRGGGGVRVVVPERGHIIEAMESWGVVECKIYGCGAWELAGSKRPSFSIH
jgi:hypothetical protein